jgi:hypothetical protein
MRWRLDAGNGTFGEPETASHLWYGCGRGLPLGSLGSHALADVAKLPDVILMRF